MSFIQAESQRRGMTHHPMRFGRLRKSEITVVCSYCKRIIKGQQEEEAAFRNGRDGKPLFVSHGMCPDCLLTHFPNQYLEIQQKYRLRIKRSFEKEKE